MLVMVEEEKREKKDGVKEKRRGEIGRDVSSNRRRRRSREKKRRWRKWRKKKVEVEEAETEMVVGRKRGLG